MNLADLFRGHRRSEPMTLLVLKLLIMIILIACLTGYLAIVIIDITQDAPIIRTSYMESPIRPPSFVIKSNYNFTINCLAEYFEINEPQPTLVDCLTDVTQPSVKYEPTQLYYGIYEPSQNILFFGDNDNSLSDISLVLYINDSNYTSDEFVFILAAVDSDDNSGVKFIKEGQFYELPYSEFNEKLNAIDPGDKVFNYNLILYQFAYQRKIEEVIKPSWTNDFGIPPTYENRSYVESTITASLFNTSSPMVIVGINPKSNTIQVDKEVRTHTYLNGLGLIGGAWGLAAAIYTLLFGADTLRPWGIVQMYCCGFSRLTQKKLKKTLPIIPFFDTNIDTKDHPSIQGLSIDEKIELIPLLQSRIDSLELFLQEYVVDVYYLNGIRDKLSKSRTTTIDTMRGFDNSNTNSMYIPVSTAVQQQNFAVPPNSTPNFTSKPQFNTNNISDTRSTLYDVNPSNPRQ
ncbi:hypothetical protein RclHR1_05970010 [Rhizophagus clarus]|uniref:Uncharacterized protein n=1 Tax=Rhizophagus clarus TaxID=94130 RepID=A0A2Z6RVR6_9GLOM|nr:hypothetical protein RclHR1_05970010 [Rhizophagus clarus]